jgi:hypothetical protein
MDEKWNIVNDFHLISEKSEFHFFKEIWMVINEINP